MAKRKTDPPKVVDRSGPDPSCGHCKGKGIYAEYAKIGMSIRIRLGRSGKPLSCSKCWSK